MGSLEVDVCIRAFFLSTFFFLFDGKAVKGQYASKTAVRGGTLSRDQIKDRL